MPIWNNFPYSNTHELNLDYILETQGEQEERFTEVINTATEKAENAASSAENAARSAENAASSAENAASSAETAVNTVEPFTQSMNQIALNTQRINNILVQGTPTEGNAELIDIRVGADGTTYPTAGDAVRGQFTELNDILDDYDTNVHLVKNLVLNYVQGKIAAENNGRVEIRDATGYNYCYAKVKPGTKISLSNPFLATGNFAVFANTNGAYIGKMGNYLVSGTNSVYEVPANANCCYAGMNGDISNLVMLETEDIITGATITDYPYNTVVDVIIRGHSFEKNVVPYIIDKAGSNTSMSSNSLLEGLLYCYDNGIKNIRIKPGTYNMISEYTTKYGSSWDTVIANYQGIPVGKGMRVIFDDGANVLFNYQGTAQNIHTQLSLFNLEPTDCYIEGLHLICGNIRYGIHDECGGAITPYVHTIKNCTIIKTDNNTDWTSAYALAGGLGKYARVEIDGGMYKCENTAVAESAQVDTIYYHSNGSLTGVDARIYIHGIYCYGPVGSVHSGGQIQQDGSIAEMFVHDCRFNRAPNESEPRAIKLYAWNNTIETD